MDSIGHNTASVLKVVKSPVKKVNMDDVKCWLGDHNKMKTHV